MNFNSIGAEEDRVDQGAEEPLTRLGTEPVEVARHPGAVGADLGGLAGSSGMLAGDSQGDLAAAGEGLSLLGDGAELSGHLREIECTLAVSDDCQEPALLARELGVLAFEVVDRRATFELLDPPLGAKRLDLLVEQPRVPQDTYEGLPDAGLEVVGTPRARTTSGGPADKSIAPGTPIDPPAM